MGARQSKRSVDISAGATKAEKGPAGEPLENGTITSASADEKQVVEANGGVEETPKQNGSTPHVDEKENAEAASPAQEVKEPENKEEEKTEVAPVSEANGDLDTTADESVKSPTDESSPAEVQASAEKKRKKKKFLSFRNISFSKKDKSKPAVKEVAADVKTETVKEVAEEEVVTEEAKPESESAVEVPKATEEESPAAIEEKEPATESNTTSVTEIPPPLPSSPPPVETPVVPAPTIVETPVVPAPTIVETPVVPTPTIVETPAPIQPVEPEVEQAEPEDETVGGGEGLADPPEGLNTSDIEKEIAAVPLVNGNHVEEEKSDSLDIKCLADKIEAIKLSNAADISEVTNELSNDIHVNGVCDAVAVTTSGNDAGSD